jgi:GntR family transcriptional regulator
MPYDIFYVTGLLRKSVICMMNDESTPSRMVISMTTTATFTPTDGLPRIGQGSLTERTTRALLEAILDRRFPNDRLPTEPDLASRMGVSRTTIRAALQVLDRLGVISRAPGRGTQLRPHIGRECVLFHRLIGFRGLLEARFDDVTADQVFTISDHGSPGAVEALGIDSRTAVLVNDKTFSVDGRPAVHLVQEVPVAYVEPGLAEKLVSKEADFPYTIFEFSRSWPGREIDHSLVELVPQVVPQGKAAERFPLRLRAGTPYLELRETHYAETNNPVAYAREAVDDEFVRLKLVRTK